MNDQPSAAARDTAANADTTSQPTAAEFWEERYSSADAVWSGRVNRALADIAPTLTPGTALDLACGEGGDAIWLAKHGWNVTGVDISPTAAARATAAGQAEGVGERVMFEAGDLSTWEPKQGFDLVTSAFLHSWPAPIPREAILRRAAEFVAPGGHLLIIAHAEAPPWANPTMRAERRFPTPESELEALALDPAEWQVIISELRSRDATGPDGTTGVLVDSVVLAQRLAESALDAHALAP